MSRPPKEIKEGLALIFFLKKNEELKPEHQMEQEQVDMKHEDWEMLGKKMAQSLK